MPKIVFVVMSAVSRPETVDQLARALAPHLVLVHHDFSQTPNFPLSAPNIRLVPDPRRTGWASFGFVEGIFHSMAFALENLDFDYLQLLSPTCLPIRPLSEFESRVSGAVDAHFGAIDMLADRDCLMSVGYRAFAPADSVWHRVLRRLAAYYFDQKPGRRDEAGVWLRSGGGGSLKASVAEATVRLFSLASVGRHPFDARFRPYYGSVWFGAKRHVVQGLVDGFRRPGVRDYFSRVRISEEFLVPTLLMQLARRKGPLLHYISRFQEAHPMPLSEEQVDVLRSSQAYFARKFPDDPAAPIRLRVLQELARVSASQVPRPSVAERPASVQEELPTPPQPSRQREPAIAFGAVAARGLRRGWQSFSGAGRRFRH